MKITLLKQGTGYFLPKLKIKDYNIIIDGKNIFDQPIRNNIKIFENIRKIATGQGNDYTAGCLLDYPHFKKNYKLITMDLSKQQALDADPKAIQQFRVTGNLDHAGNTTVFFVSAEVKETILDFSLGIVRVL